MYGNVKHTIIVLFKNGPDEFVHRYGVRATTRQKYFSKLKNVTRGAIEFLFAAFSRFSSDLKNKRKKGRNFRTDRTSLYECERVHLLLFSARRIEVYRRVL